MKYIKYIFVISSFLFLVGCSKQEFDVSLNTSNEYLIKNKSTVVLHFELETETDVMMTAESFYLQDAVLYDNEGNTIQEITVDDSFMTPNWANHSILKEGSYSLEIQMQSKDEVELDFRLYEAKTTENNISLGEEFEGMQDPNEIEKLYFTIEEEGFYEFTQEYTNGLPKKCDLYQVDNTSFHEELYDGYKISRYLEPGNYVIELTHYRTFSYGNFAITVDKSLTVMGDDFSLHAVSGSISSLRKAYHLLTIEEDGLYKFTSNYGFEGSVLIYPIIDPKSNSTYDKLHAMEPLLFSSVYQMQATLHALLPQGEYYVVVQGNRGSDYGDYSLSFEEVDVTFNTEITNEGEAIDILPFHEGQKQPIVITLHITEPSTYTITAEVDYEMGMNMYYHGQDGTLNEYISFPMDELSNNVQEGTYYLQEGTYTLEIWNIYYASNGLMKLTVAKE